MARGFAGGSTNYLGTSADPGGILDPTTNAFSFGGWVKLNSNLGVSQVIWAKWNGTTGWILFVLSTGIVRAQIDAASPADDVAVLSTGAWHHLMFVRDGGALRIYRDGAERASSAGAPSLADTAHNFYWGHRDSGATQAIDGSIAEFAAWSAILSSAEIAALASGASPLMVRPKDLIYQPGWGVGATDEPDLGGTGKSVVETGTVTVIDHAPAGCPFPVAA